MTDDRAERLRQRIRRRQSRLSDPATDGSGWTCGIVSCSDTFESVIDLVAHQARDHPPHTCRICEQVVPDGFIAIYHAFEEHNRAEYVKAYDASADDIRFREEVKTAIEERIDVSAVLEEVDREFRTKQL